MYKKEFSKNSNRLLAFQLFKIYVLFMHDETLECVADSLSATPMSSAMIDVQIGSQKLLDYILTVLNVPPDKTIRDPEGFSRDNEYHLIFRFLSPDANNLRISRIVTLIHAAHNKPKRRKIK